MGDDGTVPEDEAEGETYSVIFRSLKHPIRRKILRMLSSKPLTFSEMLETLSMDSGHLSYHLESLGDLITHVQDGKYQLSSIGAAAVRLMGGVEEQPPMSTRGRFKPRRFVASLYPVVLAIALVVASLYVAMYTITVSTATLNQDWIQPTQFAIGAGQTFEFNVTILYWSSAFYRSIAGEISPRILYLPSSPGPDAWTFEVQPVSDTFTAWAEGSIWLDVRLNSTGLPSNEIVLMPFGLPNDLSVKVFMPNGAVSADGLHWTSGLENHFTSSTIEITQLGTYTFEIKNNDSFEWSGVLTPDVQWQQLGRPYFYWGIVGFVVAVGYIVFIASGLLMARKRRFVFK